MKRPSSVGMIEASILIVLLVILAIIIQVMDKSFGNAFTFSSSSIFPRAEIAIFGLMVIGSIAMQVILIKKIREVVEVKTKSKLGKAVLVISTLLQYLVAALLVTILLQVIFSFEYNVDFIELVVGINLITSTILLVILSARFARTFRKSPTKVMLAYTIAIAALALNNIITFIYVNDFLQRKPDYITSAFNEWTTYSPRVSLELISAYQLIGVISFATLWIATVFLTYHYASSSKKIKYWTFASIPLLYFASLYLIYFLEHSDLLGQLGIENIPMYGYIYNVFLNIVRTTSGIMFGVAFFVLSREIVHVQLKKSIIMTGIGLIILIGANASSVIIMTPFPPWGIISTTFLITGSYSLIIGLDSAAFYLATDSSLRKITSKSATQDEFLGSLGFVGTQDIVSRKIENISRRIYDEIQSDNLFAVASEPSNVKEYIDEVLRETWKRDVSSTKKTEDGFPPEDNI